MTSDLSGDGEHMRKIRRAVFSRRRANRDDERLAVSHRPRSLSQKWSRFVGQFFIGFNEDCPAV